MYINNISLDKSKENVYESSEKTKNSNLMSEMKYYGNAVEISKYS